MNILVLGDYSVAMSICKADVELFIGLQKKGVQVHILANFSEEARRLFSEVDIQMYNGLPNSNFDFDYSEKIRNISLEKNIEIIHVFHSKMLRNALRSTPNKQIKLVAYMGSTSIHWHDLSAYSSFLNPRVNCIICNSQYVYKHVVKQLFGKNKQKAVMIYKGYSSKWFLDVPSFDYKSIGIPDDAVIVTLAATFMKVKGIEYFVDSMNFLPEQANIHYVLMGTNTASEKVKKWVSKTNKAKNFHLLGFREDVKSLVKSADIYVQTSLREGFGRALSEAVSMGKPVILTENGGFAEVIQHGKNGMLIPVKNAKSIADAIIHLANDKNLRIQMGLHAQQHLDAHFNTETSVEKTYELYHDLLS